jgi:hypothetical protein
MRFTEEQATGLGLRVEGKSGTALVGPQGFAGRRIYIDGGSRAHGLRGPTIHLSGFHPDEVELLGGLPNPQGEYSSRVTGFLRLTPENLRAAVELLLAAASAAYSPPARRLQGVDVGAILTAASK